MKIHGLVGGVAALALLAGCGPSEPAPAATTTAEAPAAPAAPPAAPATPAGDNTFEAWEPIGAPVIKNNAAEAPDGTMTADVIELKPKEGLGTFDKRPVAAGDTRTAKVFMWGTEGQSVVLQLVDWCTKSAVEIETTYVQLTAKPQEFEIKHTYKGAYPCTKFQLISPAQAPITVNAWNARLN